VDESGIIETQMVNHNRSVMVAVYGTAWAIPRRKQYDSNSNLHSVELLSGAAIHHTCSSLQLLQFTFGFRDKPTVLILSVSRGGLEHTVGYTSYGVT
jgi:hypothetical protein